MSLKNCLTSSDIEIHENVDLTNHTTFKLKINGNLIIVKTINALKKSIKQLSLKKIKYQVLGLGANQILKTDITYIKLNLKTNDVLGKVQNEYMLPASIPLTVMVQHASRYGIKGWEVLTGIPATLGGAIAMNAGTGFGEIASIVKEVLIITPLGSERRHKVSSNSFTYRKNLFLKEGEIIVAATIINCGVSNLVATTIQEYQRKRNSTQPLNKKTCGCIFKNPTPQYPAGLLIDIMGLKGLTYKGMRISNIHGNFIENISGATRTDFQEFIDIIQQNIFLHYGIQLELEVIL